jgi:uncharacterized repeat protein (TIGR03803 family)
MDLARPPVWWSVKEGCSTGQPKPADPGNALCGTVFSLTRSNAAWVESVLHYFTCSDGQHPVAPLAIGDSGVLFGTTNIGGSGNYGTVFSLTPPASAGGHWTMTVLHNFSGGSDGASPAAGVTIGNNGALYGTTTYGGSGGCTAPPYPAGCGTVFELTPPASPGESWTETVIYNFPGGSGGLQPFAAVTIGTGGVLYGTTNGGHLHPGTVFSLTPPTTAGGAWSPAVLHNFDFSSVKGDGFNPEASVVIGSGGVLYGTTFFGGSSYGGGTVYSLTPPTSPSGAWTEAVICNFTGPNGYLPASDLMIGDGGVLYGTTYSGGTAGFGTVFSLTPPASPTGSWTENVLYSFTDGNDGANPAAPVAMGRGRAGRPLLYGTAYFGGSTAHPCQLYGCGTVFALQQ